MPEQSEHEKVYRLLDATERIGLRLSGGYAVEPEQSTLAIIAHHPQAGYFGMRNGRLLPDGSPDDVIKGSPRDPSRFGEIGDEEPGRARHARAVASTADGRDRRRADRARPFVSFELWPPRSPESAAALEDAARGARRPLQPAFVAITYGAGGSTRERTHELVARLAGTELLPLAHLTCAAHGRAELVALLERYLAAGVRDLLALHGDPPLSADRAAARRATCAMRSSSSRLARSVGFDELGVAVHPEGHPAAPSRDADLRMAGGQAARGRLRADPVPAPRRRLRRARRRDALARCRRAQSCRA